MTWEAWFTLAVVVIILVVLVRDLVAPAAAMVGGMVAVLVAGIVTPEEAFAGFANPAPITVAALFVLARAVEKTGALTPVVRMTLGATVGMRRSLARLVFPTISASAFLNNTPIVAMLLPQVERWAEERGRSPSLYLMPLSFAALLGGVVTVIGTSTNIVVSGLLENAGQPPIGFFEITRVGLPIALVGGVLLVVLAPRLLKVRRSVREEAEDDAKRFVLDMVVDESGSLDGRAVEAGGLRHLKGVFLAALDRDGEVIAPVTPDTTLHGGDVLRFVGMADQVLDLQAIRGLSSAEETHLLDLDTSRARYFEAVIGPTSPMVGTTLKEVGFRQRYQAAVVAIHRAGQRIDAKLGSVPLRVGDTLLLIADPGFGDRWRDRRDFLLVSSTGGTPPVPTTKAILVGAITLAIVLAASLEIIPILQASLLGAVALVVFGAVTPSEARDAVDLDVIIVIAAAFGVAAAVETSGLAQIVADGMVEAFDVFGPSGILTGVVVATVVLTGLVSNNASALLMFPIAVAAATGAGLEPRGFAIAIAVASSVDFLTPIGYQTNTMVYGPGGYRFADYPRLGGPLTLLVVVTLVALVPVFWPF
ncbi:MAG TPA: SLC13 family permease [Acidimicrobiia bacterium]|nr:SLC13 family permease [Acidimicrobiia bacterium]